MKTKMLKLFALLLFSLIVSWTPKIGLSQNAPSIADVRLAYDGSVKAEQLSLSRFKTIFGWLTKDAGKEKWRKIQWRYDLVAARAESAKLGKPIFIWAMNGDPLGCV